MQDMTHGKTVHGPEAFGLGTSDLKSTLLTALEHGGHYADLFCEHSRLTMLALQDGQVSEVNQAIQHGAGIRCLHGDRAGYAYTMNINRDELVRAAHTAACIADGRCGNIEIAPLVAMQREGTFYPISRPWSDITVGEKKDALLRLDGMVKAMDERVVKVRAGLTDKTRNIFFANSEGQMYSDIRPRATITLVVVMQQNGQTEMGFASEALAMGAEFITNERLERIARKAVRQASIMFEATKPEGGEMPVVMGAGASGILLHEAIGHAFEADFIRKKTSIFSDRLGDMICSKDITIVDDGTVTADCGALNWDDEGNEGQRTVLVDHGRLNSFLHDRISARHFHVAPTGNGRRESFRQTPLPRMRSTYMLNGTASEEEIIASVKHGIYAETYTNGQVQIGAGDFTFYVKQGHLIENGKLTRPIRDVNIIGNGPRALADITMVGNNFQLDNSAGMCGKEGQNVPVSDGIPTVLVNRLTVGGK